MHYDQSEIGFILYNNRSISGVVKNWMPLIKNVDAFKLIEQEKMMMWCKNHFNHDEKMVEISINELNINEPDVFVTPEQISDLTDVVMNSNLTNFEKNWLHNRGINDNLIEKWQLKSMTNIPLQYAETLGITCHPILTKLLDDGINGGGIIIPLLQNSKLINCTFRKISDIGKLKYTQTCPDISVWNLQNSKSVWIAEGLFDMIAIQANGKNACSVSGAMWSGIQLYQLLESGVENISIWTDKDQTGYRCSAILAKFLRMQGIKVEIYESLYCKDAAEHFLEKKLTWNDVIPVKVTKDLINANPDQSFNFLKYLKNRTF